MTSWALMYDEGWQWGRIMSVSVQPEIGDTRLETWFERDRQHVRLESREGHVLAEWWDAEVQDMVDGGFFHFGPHRWSLHESVFQYMRARGLLEHRLFLQELAEDRALRVEDDWWLDQLIAERSGPLWDAYVRGVRTGVRRGIRERRRAHEEGS